MNLQSVKVVLVGLPNTGKTTLFNQLTGDCRKVGNWCGVTVQAHSAEVVLNDTVYEIIDLPGILSVYDESDQVDFQVCREAIASADMIVNVIDARYLQRDLVLSFQLLSYQLPQVAIVTHVDSKHKESVLKAIPSVSDVVDNTLLERLDGLFKQAKVVDFESLMQWPEALMAPWDSLRDLAPVSRLSALLQMPQDKSEPYDVLIAEGFYQAAANAVTQQGMLSSKKSQQIVDYYALHPYLGLPIFLLVLYFLFSCTIGLGGALGDFLAEFILLFGQMLPRNNLFYAVLNSVLSGVATGFGFIPVLGVMYVLMGYLEQSGYLSRVALLSDRLMRPIGLSGHAFIPMILGFGCNVPAVMATRVISGYHQRLLTALMLPFMSCSARLSIFVIFAAAFFPKWGALVIMLLYILGVFLGVGSIALLSYVFGFPKAQGLTIQLPDYQIPRWPQVWQSVGLKLKGFMRRTIIYIIAFSTIFAVFAQINFSGQLVEPSQTILAIFGQYLSGFFGFMGLGVDNWQAVTALLSGLVAKEVVITTLNSLYQVGQVLEPVVWGDFMELLYTLCLRILTFPLRIVMIDVGNIAIQSVYQQYFTQVSAFAYMVFILLYFPCVSTLVVLKEEFGSFWAFVSFVWSTLLAVTFAKMVYMGPGIIELIASAVLVGVVYRMRVKSDAIAS